MRILRSRSAQARLAGLLLVSAIAAQAEPPSPAKDSAGQPVHLLTIRGKAINQEGKSVAKAKVHLVAYNTAYNREAVAEATTNDAGEYLFREAPLPLPTNRLLTALDFFGQPRHELAWFEFLRRLGRTLIDLSHHSIALAVHIDRDLADAVGTR
jgi:hypothetical protein